MSAVAMRLQAYMRAIINLLKVAFLVLFSYLLQVSVVPHLKTADVMPNLLMVCIAVLTVSRGKKYAFASGAVFGILLETMASNLRLFNLLMYPALALLCAQIFADMSELKRELLRIRIAQRQADRGTAPIAKPYRRRRFVIRFRRTTADDLDPHLRTLLNALMLTALYEGIMIIYIALEGVSPTWGHLGRLFRTLLYTAAASTLMFPARAFLNMYRFRRKGKRGEEHLGDAVNISDRDLREIALEPDLPQIRGDGSVLVKTIHDDPSTDEQEETDDETVAVQEKQTEDADKPTDIDVVAPVPDTDKETPNEV